MSAPASRITFPFWIAIFDALVGGSVAWVVVPAFPFVLTGDAEYDRLRAALLSLDAAIAVSALSALLCFFMRSPRMALFQRAFFWAMLVRTAELFLECKLPSEGNFTLALALPFLLLATGAALVAAWQTAKAARTP